MPVAAPRRRADGDEHGVGAGDRARQIGGERKPPRRCVAGDQRCRARARRSASRRCSSRAILARVLVDAGDLDAELGKARARDQPDIPGSDHRDAHFLVRSSRECSTERQPARLIPDRLTPSAPAYSARTIRPAPPRGKPPRPQQHRMPEEPAQIIRYDAIIMQSIVQSGRAACRKRCWSPAGRAISARTPARRWPRPASVRSSTTICRAGVARRCAGGRSSRATSPTAPGSAAPSPSIGWRRSCISPPMPMSASRWPIRRSITATISAARLSLLEAMRDAGVGEIVFSSTCATYGIPDARADRRERAAAPGQSLWRNQARDRAGACTGTARPTACARSRLRYFNAAGADPDGEIGECHEPETHLVPLVLQAALGQRPQIEIYGTDYPTPDGTAIRDYVHVHDLAIAHLRALEHLRAGRRQHRASISAPAAAIRCAR